MSCSTGQNPNFLFIFPLPQHLCNLYSLGAWLALPGTEKCVLLFFFGHALTALIYVFFFLFFFRRLLFSRLFLLLLPLRVDVVCIKSTISPKVFFFFALPSFFPPLWLTVSIRVPVRVSIL